MDVDRLYVSKFHNGKLDLNGVHFIFFSRVAVSAGPGISSELTSTQNLPLSIFPGMVTALSGGQCYYANLSNSTVENASFFTELGVKSTTICPIYNIAGSLIGIVGTENITMANENEKKSSTLDTLETLSGVLGGVLTLE